MADIRTFQGSSIVYQDELDGGESAMDRAVHRAFADADAGIDAGTWEVVDTQVHRVLGYGPTKYTATITVEVTNG
jgi:hypothetical protein